MCSIDSAYSHTGPTGRELCCLHWDENILPFLSIQFYLYCGRISRIYRAQICIIITNVSWRDNMKCNHNCGSIRAFLTSAICFDIPLRLENQILFFLQLYFLILNTIFCLFLFFMFLLQILYSVLDFCHLFCC